MAGFCDGGDEPPHTVTMNSLISWLTIGC